MGGVEYREVLCKSALNRVRGMPFPWSLNPYRGCVHACHYCYARASHAYFELDADRDFETKIIVKTNLPEVLRRELGRPSWRGELVAIGTATDAYQPAEGRYRLTRRALEALAERRNPVNIVTKSPLIWRDRDLLSELAGRAEVRVFFTITTVDLAFWRRVEPGTASPFKRLAVMRRLVEAGVPAGVLVAPIMPGLTDGVDSIEAVAAAAAEHGALFFGAIPLRLAPLVKEHYLGFVAASFPVLLPRYRRAYPGALLSTEYTSRLEARLARIKEKHGLTEEALQARRPQPAVAAGGQLELF